MRCVGDFIIGVAEHLHAVGYYPEEGACGAFYFQDGGPVWAVEGKGLVAPAAEDAVGGELLEGGEEDGGAGGGGCGGGCEEGDCFVGGCGIDGPGV